MDSERMSSELRVWLLSSALLCGLGMLGTMQDWRRRFVRNSRERRQEVLDALLSGEETDRLSACRNVTRRREEFRNQTRGFGLVGAAGRAVLYDTLTRNLWLAAFLVPVVQMVVPWPQGFVPPLIPLQPLLLVAALTLSIRKVLRIRRALRELGCPDCGYSLAQTRPGLPLPAGVEETVGPPRCPECGSPWPLVPPLFETGYRHV